ncbi:hypothetical protein P153DRAFT_358039 [Dothidotthia symphoricarpi CBS 119687]|uniref:Uncharacterized protein n=1 Tax=Dothidotthia symphoricarpi CBS 119687 TaxID=1392245 RepID=A0A6A6A8J7_9PLEO|nr:uncharacterized protein P153DRAFT_358039 [Dothidotthia symphoricarpi CBS 119687]KAF2127876.1 hypothetical protein P153DRAFT_358039 [Dothidotthia symphoricarpi CBS 119687]
MPSSRAHARLHKRAYSASSATSPLSPVADHGVFTFNRSETPKVTYEEPWTETSPRSMAPSHPLKIKPYLRKLSSSKDSTGLDLSRPAEENDRLAGLGISEYGGYTPSVTDVTFTTINNGRHRHSRSMSNNSQYSSSSGLQRPTPLPLIRQTPQPYTPPIARSSPPSVLGNDNEVHDIMSDEEFSQRQSAFDPSRRSDSLSSVPGLRINTNNSCTRLAASYSQSSVSLTSPVAPSRSRGATLQSVDTTTSPSSRTSLDHVSSFIRGSRDAPIDAASRAASIRAERQKFQEKEQLKERKYEQEAHRQAERNYRKLLKKDEFQRRQSETHDRSDFTRSRSISDAQNEKAPRPSVGGRQYSDHRHAHVNSLPNVVSTVDLEKQSGVVPKVTKSRAAKGRWLRFVTWFKTRLLRMSRK